MSNQSLISAARRIFWRNEPLYRAYRRLRFGDRTADYLDFDCWVGGFPRSSNTFTAQCIKAALEGANVATHLHAPLQVMDAFRTGRPGIFVIREPRAAAISWCIYRNGNLEKTLAYYVDLHRHLLPLRNRMFIASFNQTTRHIDLVLARFSRFFQLPLKPVNMDDQFINERFSEIEKNWQTESNGTNEQQVARPSPVRLDMKKPYEALIEKSISLQKRLREAEQLYGLFTRPLRANGETVLPDNIAASTTRLIL